MSTYPPPGGREGVAGVTVTLASASRLRVPSKRLARRCTQDPYQTWLGAGNTLSAAVREPN